MQLVEREQHLDRIDRLVADCLTGRGQAVLLEGPPCTGRTTLLDRVVEQGRASGALTLRATCFAMEQKMAGSLVSQLLHSAALPPDVTEQATGGSPAFCAAMLSVAARTPLLIAVDDAHHADDDSLCHLLYLARRLGAARIVLVLTLDRTAETAPSAVNADLRTAAHWQRIGVEPVSEAGVARMLTERLFPRPVPADAPAGLRRISGGNPVLLSALLDECERTGDADPDRAAAGGYGAAVVSLLRRGGPTMLRLAQALAVLGEEGDPWRAARINDLDGAADQAGVRRTVAVMTASGLLRDGRLPHPAAGSAVLDTVLGAERADLHSRAATLLHELHRPAGAVAHQLGLAGRAVAPWGVPVLLEVAEQALLAGDLRTAVSHLDLARKSAGRSADAAGILAKLAAAEWRISPALVVHRLDALVDAARQRLLEPTAVVGLVRQLLWHGRNDEAATVLAGLRADPTTTGDLGNLEAWLSVSFPSSAGPGTVRGRTVPAVEQGLSLLAGTDPWLASAGTLGDLHVRGTGRRQVDRIEQALENLQRGGSTPWAEETAGLALLGLINADLYGYALEWADALAAPVPVEQAPTWHALLESLRAEAALRMGDLAGAAAGARRALALIPPAAWGVAVGFPIGTLVTAAVRLGDLHEAADHLAFAPSEAMFHSRYGLYYLHARGLYYLATGRGYAGLADFLTCGERARSLGLDAAVTVPWRTSAARAWWQLGNEDQARRLVREQLTRSEATGGSNRGRSLRMLAVVSPAERRPQLLSEALDLFEECGAQYEQVQVLADLGRAYSALGDSRRARTTLRRARHLAERCRAMPLCDDLLALQERSEGPAVAGDGQRLLTDSERRVASLAVLGYTNREIAARLYITSSTVEQHLTRVYRKLDVKRRKDLPADLGAASVRTRPLRRQPASARRLLS
ncbi:helix-turn-helix transcriptional regulator [Micromonospora cathayae]|uniref:AAA family ATPase n=1 Tax=Micromonospora cathayae TaxID=3028804 RepID=A0ABY7ZXQ3_9ACTN|nr:LuxR family transcriptional regulator [Micromonospora sp. HUAS 3]WDZ86544.1 AAA family ATPase [Micromonospora sp. HUAS 3]